MRVDDASERPGRPLARSCLTWRALYAADADGSDAHAQPGSLVAELDREAEGNRLQTLGAGTGTRCAAGAAGDDLRGNLRGRFLIERLLEPRPVPGAVTIDRQEYERLTREPRGFIAFRLRPGT